MQGLETAIGTLLRAGVAVTAALLAAGLLLFLAHVDWAGYVLRAGLVVLLSLPAVRVVMSFADALRRRDTLLVASTMAVMAVLVWLFIYSPK
jgi:uncharacterized membrane protein